ncbi:MAG: tetratricopeptide repeat protein [Candidatus Eisenbacteria bacterium]|uniref:Tetratricopeptide repeat protein n=1 Tax=Eiseniibacteriota bacterium TaxID=2212470 RepID=A0A538TCY4_UNCEI|nr:MAG: tetratricopeptide repeat protein [Candidatus Eisenbacteria bacterium]
MNPVFRRVLSLTVGGMLLAAAAAYALQSGDIIKQGVEAYRAGQYKRALELFTQAQRLDPGGAKPHYFIGSALEKVEEPDSARVEYETAIRIDPKYVEALTGLGKLLRKQGKEEGTQKLEEAVKYGPKDAGALYALGLAYLQDKRWDDAYKVFTKGTLLKQGRGAFLAGQALALEGKGETKKAEEIFIRARETDPNNLRIRLDMGGFYERRKIPVLAAPEYVKATELDPKNPETHYLAGRALVGMNEFNAGLKEYMAAIAADSSYAPAYLEAGRLYYRAGPIHMAEAAEKLRTYTSLKPDDPQGYMELGRALAKSQNPDDRQAAIPILEKAYEQNPQSCEVAGALGKLYFERNPPDTENALKYYDKYAQCADTLMTAEEHLRLGTMYVAAKDSSKAVPQLMKAVQMDSTKTKDADFQLGFLYFARRDYAGAIPYFEAALRADSAFVPALMNIGLAELAVKQPNVGIAYLRRALDVNPKDNRPRIWIGQTLTSLDSLPEALEMYQQAMAAEPENAEAQRGAGVVLLLQKNWADAIPSLEKAVQLEPENIQGHIWLAQAYSNSGDIPKAKAEFNKVFDLDPNNKEAAKGLDYIRKYEAAKAAKQSGATKPAEAAKQSGTAKPAADPKQGETAIKSGAAKKSGTP